MFVGTSEWVGCGELDMRGGYKAHATPKYRKIDKRQSISSTQMFPTNWMRFSGRVGRE